MGEEVSHSYRKIHFRFIAFNEQFRFAGPFSTLSSCSDKHIYAAYITSFYRT